MVEASKWLDKGARQVGLGAAEQCLPCWCVGASNWCSRRSAHLVTCRFSAAVLFLKRVARGDSEEGWDCERVILHGPGRGRAANSPEHQIGPSTPEGDVSRLHQCYGVRRRLHCRKLLGCTCGSMPAEIGEKKFSTSSSRCHLRWGKSASVKPGFTRLIFFTISEKVLFKRAIYIDERKEKAQR